MNVKVCTSAADLDAAVKAQFEGWDKNVQAEIDQHPENAAVYQEARAIANALLPVFMQTKDPGLKNCLLIALQCLAGGAELIQQMGVIQTALVQKKQVVIMEPENFAQLMKPPAGRA